MRDICGGHKGGCLLKLLTYPEPATCSYPFVSGTGEKTMSDKIDYMDFAEDGLKEVSHHAPDLLKAFEKGEKQAKTRDGVIQTIDEMCDALQAATDLIAAEISKSIIEFNSFRPNPQAAVLRSYFGRVAAKFSRPALGNLLHEGRVCGEL